MAIEPQSIYIIVPAIKPRTNEFTLEEKGVLHFLERRENMYCFTRDELEKLIEDVKRGNVREIMNAYIDEFKK